MGTQEWLEAENPRGRCLRLGPEALSAVELLTLVVGAGTPLRDVIPLAHSLLERFEDVRGLAAARTAELETLPGMGCDRAVALTACFELGRRAQRPQLSWQAVESPGDAARVMTPLFDGLRREGVVVLYLGARHQVLTHELVALGSLNAAAVEPRDVFRSAVGVGAAALVIAHNHPSGSPEPSQDDIDITRRLRRCGETLGIRLLDHLVIGSGRYVSLRERGVI